MELKQRLYLAASEAAAENRAVDGTDGRSLVVRSIVVSELLANEIAEVVPFEDDNRPTASECDIGELRRAMISLSQLLCRLPHDLAVIWHPHYQYVDDIGEGRYVEVTDSIWEPQIGNETLRLYEAFGRIHARLSGDIPGELNRNATLNRRDFVTVYAATDALRTMVGFPKIDDTKRESKPQLRLPRADQEAAVRGIIAKIPTATQSRIQTELKKGGGTGMARDALVVLLDKLRDEGVYHIPAKRRGNSRNSRKS